MSAGSRPLRVVTQGDTGEGIRRALTADADLLLTSTLLDEDVAPLPTDGELLENVVAPARPGVSEVGASPKGT